MRTSSSRRRDRKSQGGRVILIQDGQLVARPVVGPPASLDNLPSAPMLPPSGVAAPGTSWIKRPN